jgi:hypothetical protein
MAPVVISTAVEFHAAQRDRGENCLALWRKDGLARPEF